MTSALVLLLFFFGLTSARAGTIVALGVENRLSKTADGENFSDPSLIYSLGYDFDTWLLDAEYFNVNKTTSSGNITVSNHYEEAIILPEYSEPFNDYMGPLIGLGLGLDRNRADQTVGDQASAGDGAWQMVTVFDFGMRFFPTSHYWLSLEERVKHSKLFIPSPELSTVLKFGIVIF